MDMFTGVSMRLKAIFMTIAAVGLLAGTAAAQDTGTLKKIKDTGTITIGHRESSIPFSYYDDKQQVVGYAMDLCMKIVDAVKAELKLPKLEVEAQPGDLGDPHSADGERHDRPRVRLDHQQSRAAEAGRFTITHFVTANRFVAKKASNIKTLDDLKGKTVVSTSGTTNIKQITELNAEQNLGMNILPAKDHAEAFLMVETGRAAAFVMDDILLYSLVASSKNAGGLRDLGRGALGRALRHHAAQGRPGVQEGRRRRA